MSQELISRLTNEGKVERTACPALDSLYRDASRRNTQTQLRAQGRYTLRCTRSDCKEEKRNFEPREILPMQQAPTSGSTIPSTLIRSERLLKVHAAHRHTMN